MVRPKAPVGAPKPVRAPSDQVRRLEALRDRLEAAVGVAELRDLAPLSTRYQAVLTQLAELPVAEGADGIDDISIARQRRRKASGA